MTVGYSVDQIEDAIKETLSAASALSYLRRVSILPGLDRKTLEDEAWQGAAVGIIGTSGDFNDDMTGITDEAGLFAVVAVNRNLRSDAAALRGVATGEAGTWDIVADCRQVLQHSLLGLDIFDCLCRRRYLLFATAKAAACVLEVEVSWRHSD